MPQVTVLMPCFNGERWLAPALESILSQTFEDYEALIVDDGSTDGSAEIIRTFERNDTRMRYIYKPNSGIADTLNLGLSLAKGKWIARLDADDLSVPFRLERQFALANAREDTVFVGSGAIHIDTDGRELRRVTYPVNHEDLYYSLLRNGRFPAHSSAFFLRELALELGGYRAVIKRAEDCDLWLRLFERGHVTSDNSALIYYRLHENQISNDEAGLRCYSDALVARTSHIARINGIGDPLNASDGDRRRFFAEAERISIASPSYKALCYKIKIRQIMMKREKLFADYKRIVPSIAGFMIYFTLKYFHKKEEKELIKFYQSIIGT